MINGLGYSVFLSTFNQVKDKLATLYKEGDYIFTSLHIKEEFDDTFANRAVAMLNYVKEIGYKVIADVSQRTLEIFGAPDIVFLASTLKLDVVRIDYGYTFAQICEMSQHIPLALNASTLSTDELKELAKSAKHELYACFNYYLREESGLGRTYFKALLNGVKESGLKAIAFIAGDEILRGPIYKGLPTLEEHRGVSPYVAYLDMKKMGVDGVFVGDGIISACDANLIKVRENSSVFPLPAKLDEQYRNLYGKVFTLRIDSPETSYRLLESREYATQGMLVPPENTFARNIGAITIDNEKYGRYSGEIQLITKPLAVDERVNVIGLVKQKYLQAINCLYYGDKIMFVEQ